MATAAEKTQAQAALADYQALAPAIRASVLQMAKFDTSNWGRVFMKTDGSRNPHAPNDILARIDAIAAGMPVAAEIVNDATTTG